MISLNGRWSALQFLEFVRNLDETPEEMIYREIDRSPYLLGMIKFTEEKYQISRESARFQEFIWYNRLRHWISPEPYRLLQYSPEFFTILRKFPEFQGRVERIQVALQVPGNGVEGLKDERWIEGDILISYSVIYED